MTTRHKCPECHNTLTGTVKRELTPRDIEKHTRSAHANGGAYLVREPIGYELIGHCAKHGMQRILPKHAPRMVRA